MEFMENTSEIENTMAADNEDEFIEPIECNEENADIILADSKLMKETPVVLLGYQDAAKLNNNSPTYLIQCRASTCYNFYKDLASLVSHELQEHNKISSTFKVVTVRNINIYLEDCILRPRFHFRPRPRQRRRWRDATIDPGDDEVDEGKESDGSLVPSEDDFVDAELDSGARKKSTKKLTRKKSTTKLTQRSSFGISIITDPTTGTQTYKCKCTAAFPNMIDLKTHMQSCRFHNPSHPTKFSCTICHVGLSSKQNLIDHKKSHQTLKKPSTCTICNINFLRPSDLHYHDLKTHGVHPNQCKICFKSFNSLRRTRCHELQVHRDLKNFHCAFCEKSFPTSLVRSKHERTHKNQRERNFPCSFCDSKFFDERMRKRHENIIHRKIGRESWLYCEVCGRGYRSESTFKNHICATLKNTLHLNVLHEPEVSVDVDVDGRIEVYSSDLLSVNQVDKTIVVEPTSQEKPVTSSSSTIIQDVKERLKDPPAVTSLSSIKVDLEGMIIKQPPAEDLIDIHDEGTLQARFNILPEESDNEEAKEPAKGDEEYILPGKPSDAPTPSTSNSKSKSKNDKSNSNSSSSTHPNLIKLPPTGSTCPHCSFTFAQRSGLQKHLKKINNDLLGIKYRCHFPFCCRHFVSQHNLQLHLINHKPRLDIKCQECGQVFHSKHGFKYHMRRHAGHKPFKCNYEGCNASYVAKQILDKHILKNHTRIKKWNCSYCDKKFLLKEQLIDHERTHTGEKPLHCKYCNRPFSTYNKKNGHERLHVKYSLLQKNSVVSSNNNNKTDETGT